MSMTIERADLLGSWALERTYETVDGTETGRHPLGEGASGVLHYLPDGRMAVLMANGGRTTLSKGRYNSGEAETADSARTFTAYAGTFTVQGDDIVHHLDLCLYENHSGTDYLRHARREDDRLTLAMPPVAAARGEVQWHLEWRRMSSFGG
jgi:hypothetical protein